MKITDEDTRNLYHFLGVIRNRRWFLGGVVSISLLLALVASFLFTHEYRASATIQINPERSDFYDGWRQTGTIAENRTNYLTDLDALTANGLAYRTIEDLQLWDHEEFSPWWKRILGVAQSEHSVVEQFLDRIRVTTVNGSMLINVQFSASDPNLASTVLNALVDRFTKEHNESISQIPGRAADWMSEKIPELKSALSEAETKMDAYRREHGLVDVNGSISGLNELELSHMLPALTSLSQEIEQIRLQLAEAMSIFEDMNDPEETGERLESLEMVSSDPMVQEAWIRRDTALNHKQTLSIKYGPKHPSMIDVNSQLASINAEIADRIDQIITTQIKLVESMTRELATSESRVAEKKLDMMSTQEKRLTLNALERDVETQRQLVDRFYVDTVMTRSLEGFEPESAVIVDAAVTPLQPYRPQRAILLMLVALSSSTFALLFVFVHEHVDDKIRNTRDVDARLRINLLGILPEYTSEGLAVKPGKSREPALMYRHSEVVAEAVNNIRTSLITHPSKSVSDASVLLVTSSLSGEGSTTAAVALAHSFARLDRVLLIDCHLRRTISPETSGDNDAGGGLNSLIAGKTIIKDCVIRDALGGDFDMLVCPSDAARSTAILASSEFKQLLEKLRTQYDRIILDAAALQRDSSSIVLAGVADATVYVVRSHSTRKTTILRGINRLRTANGLVAGVMINRIDPNRIVSYGGDYDYASYCGDISYKEKTDLDILRDTLNTSAGRVRKAYSELDASTKWQETRLKIATLTQWVRTMRAYTFIKDLAGPFLPNGSSKESEIDMTKSTASAEQVVDSVGSQEPAEDHREKPGSVFGNLVCSTAIVVREKLTPWREKTSEEISEETSCDTAKDAEPTSGNSSTLIPFQLSRETHGQLDGACTSDQSSSNEKAVAEN